MADNKHPAHETDETSTKDGKDLGKGRIEAGMVDLGTDEHGRPSGGSTARAATGINPQDPVDSSKVRTA